MTVATQPIALFVDGAIGNDANSGSSAGASPVASGTGAVTDGTAVVDLSADSPDLSGVSSGDVIRIVGRGDGFTSDEEFEITAVDDGLDTVNVNPSPGAAGGQTWKIGGAFATIDAARFLFRAGNGQDITINVKSSATYNEMVDCSNAHGAVNKPMVFRGYDSAIGDDGVVTVDAQSARNYAFKTNGTPYVVIENFWGKNANISAMGGNGTSVTFRRCRGSNSVDGFNGSSDHVWEGCYADNNTARGWDSTGVDNYVYGCIAWGNGTDGIAQGNGVMVDCLAVSNGTKGLMMTNAGAQQVFRNCTVDGDNKDTTVGIDCGAATIVDISNCIVYDCGTGIAKAGAVGDRDGRRVNSGNLINNCTTPLSGWPEGVAPQTGAPVFVNEDTDYGLQTSSPAAQAAVDAGYWGWVTNANGGGRIGAMVGPSLIDADWPAVGDVQNGVAFDNGGRVGTFTEPGVGNVETGVQYGAGGTEFTGTFDKPAVGDVETGVTYGGGGSEFTGTFDAPSVGDVETGEGYGAGGAEFTGTFDEPGVANVLSGVSYGEDGTEFDGLHTEAAGGGGGGSGFFHSGALG